MLRRCSVGALLLVALAAPARADVKLAMKFKADDKFFLENVNKAKQTIEFMGQKIEQETEMVSVSSIKVLKADDKETVLEQKVESMKVKNTGGVGGANPFDQIADKIKGVTFKITLDPKGQVTKFEGFDDMIRKLSGDNEQMAKFIKMSLTEDAQKQQIAEVFGYLPDKEVKKGDTWERKVPVPFGPLGTFESKNTYTYNGPGKDGEEISYKSVMTYTPPKGDNPFPFKITKGDFKADDAKGTIVFDNKLGRMVRQEGTAKIKGSMTIEVAGQEATMSVDVDQVATVRVTDKNPEEKK